MKHLLCIAAVWMTAGFTASCGDDAQDTPDPEICDDGEDNDGDGTVDCDDADCQTQDVCTREPVFHVFLLIGQSNMVGYPRPLDEDMVEDERILVLGKSNCSKTGRVKDEWDQAAPPLHACSDGLGPGDYFAKTLIEALPEGDTIGLVPCGENGEAIETFLKDGGEYYDGIIRRAKIAQDSGGVIDGILFHQGESNNGQTFWKDKVATLVADLKADLGIETDIPFLAGELLYSGSCAGHNKQIAKLPDVIPNAYVISAEGLEVDPSDTEWELHFSRDAEVEFGKRYGEKMIEVLPDANL